MQTFMPESTPWLALKTETRPFFAKVVLRRLRTVRGRVLDSQGKPVAGASVRQAGDGPAPTQDMTDAEGRFALPASWPIPRSFSSPRTDTGSKARPIARPESRSGVDAHPTSMNRFPSRMTDLDPRTYPHR